MTPPILASSSHPPFFLGEARPVASCVATSPPEKNRCEQNSQNLPLARAWLVVSQKLHVNCTMRGPRSIAKLVNITSITMVFGTYNYSYWGLKTNL